MNYFSRLYDQIRYPVDSGSSIGLRNAQIGAVHAIASHATLCTHDSSIIVMPTGSGKTAVLMIAPFILRKNKVLIVTPSAMVRGQIANDYKNLKTLKEIGVLQKTIDTPQVFEAKHRYSEEQREELSEADVVIASHQVAESISDNDIGLMFDYIIIDEAHHVPAPTWQKILKNMSHADSLLVTATPFRLDRKKINGSVIYNYPLSKAYQDGIFGSIRYLPVQVSADKDKLIAREAERVLNNDRNDGFNHFLMVRTDSKEKAKQLEGLYSKETSLRLKRIDSSMSYSTITKALDSLRAGVLDGIICVDMLGEGFDFPNLKIAAIHEPQKSLASTLQFIGRFARTNASDIGEAKFIAMNDEDLRIENNRLYSSDAVWQDLIVKMSEERIDGDIQQGKVIEAFSQPKNENRLSLFSIRPNCHAKVYRVRGFDIHGLFPDSIGVEDNVYVNTDLKTVVGIAINSTVPLWLDSSQEINTEFNLYIVHFQEETGLLFIFSQIKTEAVYESIAEAFTESYKKIPRNEMNRVLAGFADYEFFNTGMQNRNVEAGESYRICAGSNTAASIDEQTGMLYSAGHAFCKANNGGKDLTIGYSSGSKVWSSSYLSIPEYINWCDEFGKKIADNRIKVVTNTKYDTLPLPTSITFYQEDILFCFFPVTVYFSPPSMYCNKIQKKWLLTDGEIRIDKKKTSQDSVAFYYSYEGISDLFECDIQGHYTSSSGVFFCRDGVNRGILLEDYFSDNPLLFKTSDGSTYSGQEVLSGYWESDGYDKNRIDVFEWDDTDISKEVGMPVDGRLSVQQYLRIKLEQDSELSHIIFDHGTGEIADFITLKEDDTTIHASLYHCKAMKGRNYNSSVSDVYEVAQQAVKCTVWLHNKSGFLSKLLERLRNNSDSKLVRGNQNDLCSILRRKKIFEVTICIVQPAISKTAEMSESVGRVLSAATFYIKNSGRAKELRVIGSY